MMTASGYYQMLGDTAATPAPSWTDKIGTWIGIGQKAADVYSQVKSGSGSSAGSGGSAIPAVVPPPPQPSFFEKYKVPIVIGGGVAVLGTVFYFATRKRKK